MGSIVHEDRAVGAPSGDPPNVARPGLRHLFIRDLIVEADIGVYPHEHLRRQAVRVNIDLAVVEASNSTVSASDDRLHGVVDYEPLVTTVRRLATERHTRLVETLAERVAAACLGHDDRVVSARVRIEKLEILGLGATVGVEIERRRTQ